MYYVSFGLDQGPPCTGRPTGRRYDGSSDWSCRARSPGQPGTPRPARLGRFARALNITRTLRESPWHLLQDTLSDLLGRCMLRMVAERGGRAPGILHPLAMWSDQAHLGASSAGLTRWSMAVRGHLILIIMHDVKRKTPSWASRRDEKPLQATDSGPRILRWHSKVCSGREQCFLGWFGLGEHHHPHPPAQAAASRWIRGGSITA